MAAVRITIGAALDPGAVAVFGPLIQAAARARAKMASEAKAAASEAGKTYRDAPAHAKKAADEAASATEKGVARETAARRAAANEQKRILGFMQAQQLRGIRQEAAAADALLKRRQQAARGMIGGAAGSVAGIARAGAGVAGRIAGGAGVNLDIGSHVGNVVENESKAVAILNQVRIAGQKGPAGGKAGLLSYAQKTGNETGQSTGSVLDALGEFQAKSADLKTGQAVMGDLGKLALAAGADFKEVGAAAAFINAQLDDTPERGEKLLAIMRAVTAQTAQGQIELKDWAKYMPRIAAAANSFSGDYSKNIGMLSALAQISVKGGRSTAAEASGSAAALGRDLRKQNTLKAFAAEKVDVFTDKKHTAIRPIQDIIFDTIEKTKGDQAKLAKMWKNVNSAAPVMALANVYNKAGGGKKGMEAAKAELSQYNKTISKDEIGAMAGDAMDTNKAKMALFNNQLEKIAAETLPKLVPAFEKLAPVITRVADGFAGLLSWTATNPGQAIALAITGSVAKELAAAGLGKIAGKALQSGLGGGMGGALGITLAFAAATILVTEGTIELRKQAEANTTKAGAEALNQASDLRAKREKGELSQKDLDQAQSTLADLKRRDEAAGSGGGGMGGAAQTTWDALRATLNYISGGAAGGKTFSQIGQEQADRRTGANGSSEIKDGIASLERQIALGHTKVMKVHVMNPTAPGADPAARTGPQPVR